MVVLVALLATACSSGSANPGVANVGSSPVATTVAPTGNSGSDTLTPKQLASMTKWAGCVRKHGFPDFPDPPFADQELNKMGFTKVTLEKVDEGACHADALASGAVQSEAELQQHLEQELKIAHCMQANGVPNFPDPTASGALLSPASMNTNTPQYARAAKKCDGPPPGPTPGSSNTPPPSGTATKGVNG